MEKLYGSQIVPRSFVDRVQESTFKEWECAFIHHSLLHFLIFAASLFLPTVFLFKWTFWPIYPLIFLFLGELLTSFLCNFSHNSGIMSWTDSAKASNLCGTETVVLAPVLLDRPPCLPPSCLGQSLHGPGRTWFQSGHRPICIWPQSGLSWWVLLSIREGFLPKTSEFWRTGALETPVSLLPAVLLLQLLLRRDWTCACRKTLLTSSHVNSRLVTFIWLASSSAWKLLSRSVPLRLNPPSLAGSVGKSGTVIPDVWIGCSFVRFCRKFRLKRRSCRACSFHAGAV